METNVLNYWALFLEQQLKYKSGEKAICKDKKCTGNLSILEHTVHVSKTSFAGSWDWKLQNNSAFSLEKGLKDLPVRHYFRLSWTGKHKINSQTSTFLQTSFKNFYLSTSNFTSPRSGRQSVIPPLYFYF